MGLLDENTFGTRLKLARKMAGLSLQDLSDALSGKVTKQALSKYEQGEMIPSSAVLLAIADELKLKPDYFLKKKTLELGDILFRKRASLSRKEEEAVIEKMRDYVERYLELEEILNVYNPFNNPVEHFAIQTKADVESAAIKLREEWNLGDKPISNIIEMLEFKGVKVFLINDIEALDGMAVFTASKIPVIVINGKGKSIERIRFTIIHELAHLILNLSVLGSNHKMVEEWCHYFASCFLLPTNMLKKMIGQGKRSYIYINELVSIKEYFGLSIRAIVHRLKELQVITENYYQRWVVFMSKTYGAKDEPGEYKGEESSKGFNLLIGRGLSEGIISLSKAASLCNTDINHLRKEYVSIS